MSRTLQMHRVVRRPRNRGLAVVFVPLLAVWSLALAGCGSASAPAPAAIEAPAPASAGEIRWTIDIQGNEAGAMVETPGDEPGEYLYRFSFNDRGRGPKIEARWVGGPDGTPTAFEATGQDYLAAPVDETFRRTGDTARWKSTVEEGETELAAPAFYVSGTGLPAELGLLAAAALEAPDGRLDLLPAGEARARVVGTEEVASATGETTTVRLVELSGLGFAPATVWLDEDDRLFASLSSWSSIVRRGFEAESAGLLEIEQEHSTRAAEERAERLARDPRGGALAITGARLFDPASGTVTPGTTVLIRGERIAAVGADGTVEIPAGAERVDAAGRTLLPGLWDMHTHLFDTDGLLHLAAGVTSVRDLANDVGSVTRLRDQWESGEAIGPRVTIAGFLDGPGPYAGPTKALVTTFEEAREWIDRYHSLGFRQVKLYSSLDPELVEPIADYAHSLGMTVSGHLPHPLVATEAVERGFDELQHVNFLFLSLFEDRQIDTRTPQRFTVPAERAADVDLESPEVAALTELLLEHDVVVDPTLAIFEEMFTHRAGEPSPPFAMVAERLPPLVRRSLLSGGLEPPEGQEERYAASFRRMVEMVGHLHRAGVRIVPGTDTMAGFGLHRELELYAEAGIPEAEVLALATLEAARRVGQEGELGSIEPGKLADLVLVDGDPTEEMSAIRRTDLVVKGGTVYSPEALYRELGVAPYDAVP